MRLPKRQQMVFDLVRDLKGERILGDIALDRYNKKALHELVKKGLIDKKNRDCAMPLFIGPHTIMIVV